MPAPSDVSIHIEAENRSQQAFRQAEQSLESLERQTRELQNATRATAAALGLSGNAAQEAGTGFTSLGRQIFNTQDEAKRLGGVFRSLDGRLRESNGRFVKGREAVRDWTQAASKASSGAGILTRSVGSLGGALGALSIATVVHQLGRLGVGSVQAAGQMEQLRRATEQIQGSAAAAEIRISELIQVANLPGLNFEPLVRYANQFATLGLSAEDTDKILLGVGQTVVSLGGTSASSERSLIQILQAFRAGTIDLRDFRTIITEIPGILNAAADVHGVEANISGLREAFEKTGGSMRDLLIPVFDELSRRFEAPPADSYIVAMDTLQNAFFLTQSAIGDLLLPTVVDAAMALSDFFEAMRAGIKDVSLLPEPIQAIIEGTRELYDGLLNVAESIGRSVGPEVNELLPALATLLGGILELAGAIANALAPAYELLSKTTAVVVALITKLAQDITSLIGVITDFVGWASSMWQAEDRVAEATQRVSKAIETVDEATKNATTSTQEYYSNLGVLLGEIQSVNAELEEKKARLKELEAEGLEPADASMAQIVRRIALLETRSKSLTASLPDLKQELENVNSQLADKEKRLAEATKREGEASASAQQLQRQITNLTALASLLNVQIAQTTTELTETAPAAETAAAAVENYSLTLARLKAQAEDARDTLSDTINFQKLGANYQAAIAASDGYYNRQIANAEAALASAEADSDEYFKIETNLFKLQRDQAEARKKLTEQASKVGETEAERRVEIAEKEHERLRGAGEETARALEASEKRRTAAAEAEQKRLTQVHEDNLKAREEAERASNERIVKNSEEQLSALSNAFENAVPESVDRTYENIQNATVQHYETLKNLARNRITDEDALNAELVSLDRQRNAALEGNHRDYIQRLAQDAKSLLGERTEAFKTASNDILHDWERTVSEFERQLREADTEDAIRAIESDFETAQQQMLASLESVLTELGFTADETAKIMQSIFRTAEGEADGFADKVISAFQRLGKAADRETKQQNRQIERNYRELVSEIEHILSNITDFFIDITRGGDIEDAFRQLGERVAGSFLDVFTRDVSENLAASLSSIASETDVAGAATSGGTGAGGAIQAAGGLTSILSLITSSVALAAIVPAVVFATTKFIGDKVGQTGVIDNPNRQGRPLEDNESRRRRGESQSAYESRLRAREEAEAAIAERETFFGNYDPRAPFGQAIQETGIFTGDSGYFAESALRQTDIDVFGNIDLPGLIGDLEGILQTRVEGLSEDMQRAASALESASGADLKPALDQYFSATTDFYQTQIDFANFVRRTTGNLSFGDAEGLSRQLQDALNQARLQDTSTNLTLFGIQRNRREAQSLAEREGTDRDFTEQIARAQYGDVAYDAEVAAAGELATAESIAPVIDQINEGIGLINASILSINTQIDQSNDPEEIARLLSQVPDLIRQKYEMLRDALDARYNAGEIGVDVYNASLSELQSNEAREIEQHSDAVLANTLRTISEDVQLIDAEISALQTQIDQLSEPTEIVDLLSQIPGLLTEKYRKLRDALNERYAAGEISVDVYNASLTALATTETAETERHSDAVLAETLADIDDDVQLIDANIGALQLSVEQSDDPDAIAGLLDAIKILVMDKYAQLRERLGELLAAEEISQDSYDAALIGLGTAESRALADLDTQALTAISTEAQKQVDFINGSIENLRLSLQLADDPQETQRILDAIKVLVGARFDVLIEELNAIKDTLTDDQFSQALQGLQLGRQLALENIDTEKFDAISTEAQKQADFISGSIENLRLALQLTDDPTESQQIIDAIKVLTTARFQVLRDELNAIKDILKPEEFEQALKGINLGEQLALENLDTQKFQAISEEAQGQVNLINGNIENLRLALQLTDDPTEQQQIITAIKTLTVARFRVLREELLSIRDSLDPEVFEQALTGLNLGEQLALQNLDTESFGVISAAAQGQVDFINGAINNLELALQLTDDPVEIQRIIAAIRTLTGARFDVLIQELKALEDSLDPAIFNQALEGLTLGKAVALRGVDNQAIGVTLSGIGEQINDVDFELTQLFDDLENQTTGSGVSEAIMRLRTAIETKYQLLRDKINESAENEEDKARQIEAVDFQEGEALGRLGQQGVGALGSIVDTAQFLLDNATEAEFATRRQDLIDAIKDFYDARIEFINSQDLSDTDRANMAAVAQIQRNIALDAIPQMHESVTERLELEKDLQTKIADLRDDGFEAEADRLASLENLQARHNAKILDLEEDLQEDLDDLRRERIQDAQDLATEYQRDIQDLQNEFARELFGESVISFADLTAAQQRQLQSNAGFQQERFDLDLERDRDRQDINTESGVLRAGSPGEAFYRQQIESGELTDTNLIERLFGRQGLDDFIDLTRGTEDAQETLDAAVLAVETESRDLLTSIDANIALLTGGQLTDATTATLTNTQQQTATLESQTAMLAAETTAMAAETTATQMATAEMESATAAQYATVVETLDPAVVAFGTASETLLAAAVELTAFDLTTLVAAVDRIPTGLLDFTETVELLPQRLDDVLNSSFERLPDIFAQAIGAAPSTASLLPTATGTQPAGKEVPPIGNSGLGGQEIKIMLVGDFGDAFAQKMGEVFVRLDAEGRLLQQ